MQCSVLSLNVTIDKKSQTFLLASALNLDSCITGVTAHNVILIDYLFLSMVVGLSWASLRLIFIFIMFIINTNFMRLMI